MREVDEVRAAADIVKIVGDYVKLRKAGVHHKGLCPFHREKTPSFAVHPGKQVFHCFGCKAGGDVFNFVMLIEHLTFPEALRRVAEKAGVTLHERVGDETYDAQSRDRAALYKIHEEATKFFQAQLGATAEGRAARGYLADRGLGDETIARFRLGYAPSHGQGLTRHLLDLGFDAEILEKSGLILRDQACPERSEREGKRHFDRFRRRITFPISNESGKVVAFGGRALGDDQPKYLNSPETPIYTKSRVLYHLDRAGSVIRKQGGAAYEKLLSAAPSYIDYLTERAASQHDLSRPEGRVAAANAVLPHLAKVPDAMLRTQLAQGLALRLRLDQRSVQEELKRAAMRRETQVN